MDSTRRPSKLPSALHKLSTGFSYSVYCCFIFKFFNLALEKIEQSSPRVSLHFPVINFDRKILSSIVFIVFLFFYTLLSSCFRGHLIVSNHLSPFRVCSFSSFYSTFIRKTTLPVSYYLQHICISFLFITFYKITVIRPKYRENI